MVELAKLILTPFVYLAAVIIALLLAWHFRYRLKSLLSELDIKKIKAGPFELERATEVAAAVVNDREKQPADKNRLQRDLQRLPLARILWVDDKPEGNAREIEALDLAGLTVDTVRSNEEAARRVSGREYDLVVSDIGRAGRESPTAGLELPKELMPDRNRVPPIIYYVTHLDDAWTSDRYPVTNKPSELFRMIGDVLRWKR